MRRKPSTPSRSFSTTASRRNRAGAALVLACVLLGLIAVEGTAQAMELSVAERGGIVGATMSFQWTRSDLVIESLLAGLESRITFTTRLCESRRPALSFAGDRVLAERTVTRSVFWDFLDKAFVVEQEGMQQKTYTDPGALVSFFFSQDEVFTVPGGSAPRRRLYVAARAQFEPVRLVPPLTLVSLAGAAATVTSPWVRRDAP